MRIAELKDELKKARNLVKEIEIVRDEIKTSSNEEKKFLQDYLDYARIELKKISANIPDYVHERKITGKIALSSSEKKLYLEETGIDKDALKSARKKIEGVRKREKETAEYQKPGFFTKSASKIFSPLSLKIEKGNFFQGIKSSLRKANMPYLLSTYISAAILSTLIVLIISILLFSPLFVIMGAYAIAVLIAAPLLTFFGVLFYPLSEISTIRTKIDDELPFATMHMSAIASSGVEPSKVFSILASSPEYPNIRKEMRKIVNMLNFYGYDLSTALKTTARTTSSQKLAELLGGMSSTIMGGGDLKNYLERIATDSLLDYKLKRKRFITIAETYADIYTGLLIAAPLMFMLILVLMNVVTGNIGGLSSTTISILGIGAIIVLNIGFLIFLQISQPES